MSHRFRGQIAPIGRVPGAPCAQASCRRLICSRSYAQFWKIVPWDSTGAHQPIQGILKIPKGSHMSSWPPARLDIESGGVSCGTVSASKSSQSGKCLELRFCAQASGKQQISSRKLRPAVEDGPLEFHKVASANPRNQGNPKGQAQVILAPGASGPRVWWCVSWHRFRGQMRPMVAIGQSLGLRFCAQALCKRQMGAHQRNTKVTARTPKGSHPSS